VRFWQALPDDHPKKLVMGQWAHEIGDTVLPDLPEIRHAWFDYWLLGYDGTAGLPDTGVMDLPRVDSQINTKERFESHDWPGAGAAEATLDLGEFTHPAGDASWQSAPLSCLADGCVELQSKPLTSATRIAGAPKLDLAISTKALAGELPLSTQVIARLEEEVGPDQFLPIATGMLNSRQRAGERASTDLPASGTWTGTVELDLTDYVVAKGSRLRLTLTSYEPDPSLAPDDDAPVTNTLLLSGARSRLRLPVVGYAGTPAGAGLPLATIGAPQ
jgi:hypothetical protein